MLCIIAMLQSILPVPGFRCYLGASTGRMGDVSATAIRTLIALFVLSCLSSSSPSTVIASPETRFVVTGQKDPLYSALAASQWKFSLPESTLQQAFIFQGSTGRLKQVIMKLLTGQTVKVGAVGGSITAGCCTENHADYFVLVSQWLQKAFPKSKIISRNGAIGATPSMYMEHFLDSRLDPGVDLVLLEYAINNAYRENTMYYEDVASFERLLRLLMTGEYTPNTKEAKPAAILAVNMWRCCRFEGEQLKLHKYTEYLGDHYSVLSQYYSVPAIAVRNGLYHAFKEGKGIFSDIQNVYPSMHGVMIHPNDLGHRYMADMIIYAFYVAMAQLEQHGLTEGDLELINRPQPPAIIANASEHRVTLRSWHGDLVKEAVTKTADWAWVLDHGKWGYMTTVPHSKLQLRVDSVIPLQMLKRNPLLESASVWVYIGLLKSYEHMGVVKVECVSGCKCDATYFDTNDAKDKTSQVILYPVPVSQSNACTMQLTSEERSTSKGNEHKLVLRGLAVAAKIKL